jgi:CRISPR type III-B/RAMP module-associated protein Cmr3
MNRWTLILTPQDTLLFKGHRPFAAGDQSSADLLFPQPSSVWGAVVTALARARGLRFGPPGSEVPVELAELIAQVHVAGPWLAERGASGEVSAPWLPTPRDQGHLLRPPGAVRAWTGRPIQLCKKDAVGPGDEDPVASCQKASLALVPRALMVRAGDHKESRPAWLSQGSLSAYFANPGKEAPTGDRSKDLIDEELRAGHARDEDGTQTVREGMLYTSPRWRLKDGACLVAEVEADALGGDLKKLCGTTLQLGGKGRRVRVGLHEQAALSRTLLDEAAAAAGPRRLLLLTPAVLDEASAQALAACGAVVEVGHPEGGWDFVRNAPRPLRRTLAAGSVLLLPPGPTPLITQHHGRDHIGAVNTHKAGWGLVLRIGQDGDQA